MKMFGTLKAYAPAILGVVAVIGVIVGILVGLNSFSKRIRGTFVTGQLATVANQYNLKGVGQPYSLVKVLQATVREQISYPHPTTPSIRSLGLPYSSWIRHGSPSRYKSYLNDMADEIRWCYHRSKFIPDIENKALSPHGCTVGQDKHKPSKSDLYSLNFPHFFGLIF